VFFVNSQGFKVRIVREDGEREEPSDPPPPQRKLSDDREEDLEESEGEGWDGRRGKNLKKDKGVTLVGGGSASEPKRKSVPISAHDALPGGKGAKLPNTAFSQYGSNLTEGGDIFPVLGEILRPSSAPVESSGDMGVQLGTFPLYLRRWSLSKIPRWRVEIRSRAARPSGRRSSYLRRIVSRPAFPPL
jgi:hypothetical protein